MKLNIIGNGFDLYHGLPSSYYFFGCYLIDNNMGFYEELGKMYNIHFARMVGAYIAHDYEYIVEDIFWGDFENHLGEVDEYFIVDTYEDDLGLENDDPIDIEMNEYVIAEKLKQFFCQWVKDTLDKRENYEVIRNYMNETRDGIDFECNDYFLVFNYTHTLQNIYNISDERIHYIHGECLEDDNEGEELIIGHGNNVRINELEAQIKSLEEKYNYTQEVRNRIDENYCLLIYLKKLRKEVELCSRACEAFYERIDREIDTIKVYGMSLGDVDIPYLQQIRSKWPNADWRFSSYSDRDKMRIIEVAENILGLEREKYSIFMFSNEIGQEIQKEIIGLQNITTYKSC